VVEHLECDAVHLLERVRVVEEDVEDGFRGIWVMACERKRERKKFVSARCIDAAAL
jgi:hypothetical protein